MKGLKGFQKGHENYKLSKKIYIECGWCNKSFGISPSLIKRYIVTLKVGKKP